NAGEGREGAPQARAVDGPPELVELCKTVLDLVFGADARIASADRGADQPVRLDAYVVQRLIDAALVSAERASPLQHEDHLPVIDFADLVGGFQRGKAFRGVAMFVPPVCFLLRNVAL